MERVFRIVHVGCGGISNAWLPTVLEQTDATIVALVDLFPEACEKVKEKYGIDCPVFTDLSEAIRQTGANLVIDNTIPASHHDVAITAMRAGCDVLAEKPLADSMEAAREMVNVSRETGRSLSIMQNRRYLKGIRSLREVVGSRIGTPGFIQSDFFLGPHFGGFRDVMESPLLLDMAIHTFDMARFIIGATPVSVFCREFNPPGSWYAGSASATAIFEFSNGMVYTYNGSWCANGLNTTWEADWRITASNGSAKWDGEHAPVFEVADPAHAEGFIHGFTHEEAPQEWTEAEGHPGCIREMFQALREGRPAETNAADNIHSLAMVFGAMESNRTGQVIRF